jgi:hypothetical protein
MTHKHPPPSHADVDKTTQQLSPWEIEVDPEEERKRAEEGKKMQQAAARAQRAKASRRCVCGCECVGGMGGRRSASSCRCVSACVWEGVGGGSMEKESMPVFASTRVHIWVGSIHNQGPPALSQTLTLTFTITLTLTLSPALHRYAGDDGYDSEDERLAQMLKRAERAMQLLRYHELVRECMCSGVGVGEGGREGGLLPDVQLDTHLFLQMSFTLTVSSP